MKRGEIQYLVVRVRLLKTVLTMLVLVNWFTCTVHCQLETAGLFHKSAKEGVAAHKATSDITSSDSDICDLVATGGVHLSDNRVSAPECSLAPVIAFLAFALPDLAVLADGPQLQCERSLAPPELRSSFHFVFRTALPARAPSLA